MLELVGLKGREQERVEGYSRGMRQRLHIARGLVWTEAGVAVAYAAAGFVLFRVLERESRRSGVLDAY